MAFEPVEIGRRIREGVGIRRVELATACRVDENTISKLESGTLVPVPGDYVLIAARLLKTDFQYFISDALDDLERQTNQVFRALSDPKNTDLRAIRRFMLFCMAENDLELFLDVNRRELPPSYPLSEHANKLHKE